MTAFVGCTLRGSSDSRRVQGLAAALAAILLVDVRSVRRLTICGERMRGNNSKPRLERVGVVGVRELLSVMRDVIERC